MILQLSFIARAETIWLVQPSCCHILHFYILYMYIHSLFSARQLDVILQMQNEIYNWVFTPNILIKYIIKDSTKLYVLARSLGWWSWQMRKVGYRFSLTLLINICAKFSFAQSTLFPLYFYDATLSALSLLSCSPPTSAAGKRISRLRANLCGRFKGGRASERLAKTLRRSSLAARDSRAREDN